MSTLTGDEPELALGASGEYVTQLQDRLRALKLFDTFPDGTFGDATESAVRRLQSDAGLTPDGTVGPATWSALDEHMLAGGLQYNPYAGPGQQHWDQAADDPGAYSAAQAPQPDEPYWDGQQWLRYDHSAQQWLPVEDGETAAGDAAPAIPHIDNIHPAVRDDTRFVGFHDFLRETHGS
jgi:peptidoglycan hydrolase-like protein with peptidoglycan-binding domain